jgi:hypothetical protein
MTVIALQAFFRRGRSLTIRRYWMTALDLSPAGTSLKTSIGLDPNKCRIL